MRVAIVTVSFPPDNAGAPFPASYELAKSLKALGHEVLVLTLTEKETREETVEGIRVYRQRVDLDEFPGIKIPLPLAFPNCIPKALSLFENSLPILEDFKPDIIESQEFNGLGLFFGLQRKYPFVVRIYGPLTHLLRSGQIGNFMDVDIEIVHSMEIATVGSADAQIALCNDIAQKMSDWSGVPRDRFSILPTPISPTGQLVGHHPAAEGEPFPRLLYWGRIERQKGADLLTEALPRIKEAFPNFLLTVSGKETIACGATEPYADEMRRRLEELGVSANVHFAGFLSVEELQQQVAKTDICVFPSKYETACYAAIEAAMYGGCVLATTVGGLPEHVAHGTSGYLVEPENPQALADGIIALSKDDEMRKRLREGAREDVIRRLDPVSNARESVKIYERAINEFRATHPRSVDTASQVARALISGLQNTKLDNQIYDLLCEKYSEGAKAGFEQGFAAGYEAAQKAKQDRPSIVRRIARKVKRLALS